jgi:hypothetical protein
LEGDDEVDEEVGRVGVHAVLSDLFFRFISIYFDLFLPTGTPAPLGQTG